VSRSRRIIVAVVVAATALAGIAAGVLVAAGSGGDGDADGGTDDVRTVQPGAPGEAGRELSDEEAADLGAPEHTPADTNFMQGMIVHHEQALEMTALVDERTQRADLPLLAERITVSQEAEIELIEQWLTDRDEDVPDASGHQEHELMPGMATASQLDELERARGATFDRLFLDLMIAHHRGALTMVGELYAAGGGLEPAADQFARDVEADQNIEILHMQELQGSLP
jgi:uncharacterized protein (DUF305 family)